MPAKISVILSLVAAVSSTSHVCAQGMRVSTIVHDASRLDASGNEPILSNSFTLFHNGRAYDYVESAGEVVIYEPVAKRFAVINIDRGVYTSVPFVEVQSMLKARGPKTKEIIRELLAQKTPKAESTIRMIRFEQQPKFESNFNEPSGMLSMKSPSWKYTVSTRQWNDAEQVQRYLEYTDWTARLNYILNPSSMFPEPRLVLNAKLKELKNRVPVVVQLDLRPDQRLVLRAEHQFVANLTDHDRNLINKWDSALKQGNLLEVPLRKYQEASLVSGR